MTRLVLLCVVLIDSAISFAAENKPNELTGTFHAEGPLKNPAYLEIDGLGFISRIIVAGDKVRSIPDNTRIWVEGTITTHLIGSPDRSKQDLQQGPTRWSVVFHVEKCARIQKPFQRPKDEDLQTNKLETPLGRDPVGALMPLPVDMPDGPPGGPPGGAPVRVVVNSQKSLADAVGDGFQNEAWEYPAGLAPDEFEGLVYVSGPADPGLDPKAAWRKPITLFDKTAGLQVTVNCYRLREKQTKADGPSTPSAPLLEPDYRYAKAEFHGLRAANASDGERDVFAFRDGNRLFKVEAANGRTEVRRKATARVAEAIWKCGHLK